MKINRADIVREALVLLNEVGLDKLSTRAVAVRLGVQQPAIYWHFKNKRALMDAMNAEMMRSAHNSRRADETEDWRSFLLHDTLGFRQALLAIRDGARVHAGSHAEASDRETAEKQLRFLTSLGFDAGSALRMLVTLARFTVGFVLEEQSEMEHPPLMSDDELERQPLLAAAVRDYVSTSQDEFFLDGLNAILDGFASVYSRVVR